MAKLVSQPWDSDAALLAKQRQQATAAEKVKEVTAYSRRMVESYLQARRRYLELSTTESPLLHARPEWLIHGHAPIASILH